MTTMRLSHVPVPGSHHVYLNGIEMEEGVDWSDDGTGLLTFLGPMGEQSGDEIEVLYAHLGELFTEPPVTLVASAFSDAQQPVLALPAGAVQAGDLMFLTSMQVSGSQTPPAGFAAYDSGVWGGVLWWQYTKVAAGGETSLSVATSGADVNHRTATGLVVVRGAIAASSPETEGTTETSTPVPQISGFVKDKMALVVALSAHGVVSGSINQPGAPYVWVGEQDSPTGKFTVSYSYWVSDGTATNPAGTIGFTGTTARHNVRTLRIA